MKKFAPFDIEKTKEQKGGNKIMNLFEKFKLYKSLSKRSKKDEGAAQTVSFIVIIFFVMWILISFIDVGIYFNIKNEMKAAADNGARNVALYGGTEGDLRNNRKNVTPAETVVRNSITTSPSSKVVQVKDVKCGPTTSTAGDEVWCKVDYKYVGIAGKFGMFFLGNTEVTAPGSATSEVNTKR